VTGCGYVCLLIIMVLCGGDWCGRLSAGFSSGPGCASCGHS